MIAKLKMLNPSVAAVCLSLVLITPATADDGVLDQLFERLQADVLPEWESIEQDIWDEWSKSGSDAMDLLLDRGRDAMERGDLVAAIEHFTALTDHAPDFAEGYNMRATAYFQAELLGPSMSDIERTLVLNPRHYGAMIGLGTILRELGREKEALVAYRRALTFNPHRQDVQDAVAILAARNDGVDT